MFAKVAEQAFRIGPAWYTGLAASLLLHALLLILLLPTLFSAGSRPDVLVPEPSVLLLSVVTSNPQRVRSPPVPPPQVLPLPVLPPQVSPPPVLPAPVPAPAVTVSVPETQDVEASQFKPVTEALATGNDSEITEQQMREIAEMQDVSEISAIEGTQSLLAELQAFMEATEQQGGGGEDRPPATVFSGAELRSAVTAYVRSARQQHTSDWLAGCMLHQKEHGTRECPQQEARDYSGREALRSAASAAFASITRPRQARLTADLMAENSRLKVLARESGPLGQLAQERYLLNRQYVEYLNGNFDYSIGNFVRASHEAMIGRAYLPTMYQFICDPMPCIYEYTGFRAKRPDAVPESDSSEFRVATSLFGSRK